MVPSPAWRGLARQAGLFPVLLRGHAIQTTWVAGHNSGGSYFITTDLRPLGFNGDDVAFCKHITEHAKVTAIPVSAFYDAPDAPNHYARFAFCKKLEVLDEAVARLRRHFRAG